MFFSDLPSSYDSAARFKFCSQVNQLYPPPPSPSPHPWGWGGIRRGRREGGPGRSPVAGVRGGAPREKIVNKGPVGVKNSKVPKPTRSRGVDGATTKRLTS